MAMIASLADHSLIGALAAPDLAASSSSRCLSQQTVLAPSRAFHSSTGSFMPRKPPTPSPGGISGTDSSDSDDDSESDDDSDDLEWEQYREVTAEEDDDADGVEPQIKAERRRIAPDMAEQLSQAAAEGAADEAESILDSPAGAIGNRDIYESHLNRLTQSIFALTERLSSKEVRRLPVKARQRLVQEAAARPEFQLPGLPSAAEEVVEPGIDQLDALTASGRWHLTIVDIKMTTKMTPQGKRHTYSAMVMVGDLNGTGGYGIGTAKETNQAIFKAIRFAILNSVTVPRYRQHTLFYPSQSKFIRTKISIFPRPLDFGLVASPILVEACELLGIRDLTVKIHKSRNVRNVVKGFFQAVTNIPTPQEVAQAKGVYIRERVGRSFRVPRLPAEQRSG